MLWLWLQRDGPIPPLRTPSYCHKCSFCLGGRCWDRLSADWLNRPSVTAAQGGGARSRREQPSGEAPLVGGAPAQQTRHAPARFALPIGRAWRPISDAEARGKHRRVHVPIAVRTSRGRSSGEAVEAVQDSRLSRTGSR